MASGGNEPVADSGGGKNSVFAAAFIKALNEPEKNTFTAEELFHGRVKEIVAGKADQVPEYNTIKNSGHEGGDFVFQLAKAMKTAPAAPVSAPEVRLNYRTESGFSLDDLEKKGQQVEANEVAWDVKLRGMKKAYAQVEAYEKKKVTPDLKAVAWERFASSFGEDNPYSTEDDAMRNSAQERVAYWQAEQAKAEEQKKLAMAPRQQTTGSSSTYREPTAGMEFVRVKGGCYQMGDTFGDGYKDEKPVHEVCVDDYYIGKYDVTQGQWQAIMGNNPSKFTNCGDNCPVEQVSWNDAQEFISKLNSRSGSNKYRLPTEAEWEYAARSGGKAEKYAGGNDIDSVAWYSGNSGNMTHPVGTKSPNGLGLYDMSGNVWQWTADWYGENYYGESPRNNPTGPNSGQYRVLRGGSWFADPLYVRAACRVRNVPADRSSDVGFRLALSAR